jgi:hypothetical protein
MVGLGVQVEICVCGIAVHFVAQRTVMTPVNIYVQEEEVAFSHCLHSLLNALVDAV